MASAPIAEEDLLSEKGVMAISSAAQTTLDANSPRNYKVRPPWRFYFRGASLKDTGKKLFAYIKMQETSAQELLGNIR